MQLVGGRDRGTRAYINGKKNGDEFSLGTMIATQHVLRRRFYTTLGDIEIKLMSCNKQYEKKMIFV